MDNALYDWLKSSNGIFLCGASLVRVGVTSCVYEVGSSARVCCTTVDQSHGVCFCGFPHEVGSGGHCCGGEHCVSVWALALSSWRPAA